MLRPEVNSTLPETAAIQRPTLNSGDDHAHDGVVGLIRCEVDDDDFIESAGSETFDEKCKVLVNVLKGK
jgi:hypothetical protein